MPSYTSELDALIAAAVQSAKTSGTIDDANKVADIAKAAAEAGKAEADSANSRRQMRLEGLKSFATFLVPVVSFLTIGFTVWIQHQQLQETQRQDEATQWREFLTSAKPSANTVQSDPTFAPRLRSFFSSPTYRDQAISISKRLMGGIADFAGFKDLFDVTFVSVNSDTFGDVLDVGRSLYANLRRSYSSCQAFADNLSDNVREKVPLTSDWAGICARTIPEKTIRTIGLNPDEAKMLSQLRRDVTAFEDEHDFFSQKTAEYLRTNYAVGSSTPPAIMVPFNGVYLFNADLSNVDFSNFDISDTAFSAVNLEGAKFTPAKFTPVDFRATQWWEAREINQVILEDLVQNDYPYIVKDPHYRGNAAVDKKHYVERISTLCVPMKPFCQPNRLPFGQ